ncbi:TPA: hypothetical protein N0F65_002606 [Lagenidium giganteum]|uniref:CCHC-type domain-containing protein n=1 Tax=Lagenidium giganteum TaxID=4803 RepID=A0AAV2YX14_9STRA|nr:TPA: hypothetical protein N0F65_002606 [Lagenidium giganteum]
MRCITANRLLTSSARQDDEEARPSEASYEQAKGLMALAKLTNKNNEMRGACKKCGMVGHLTFQCRNHLTGATESKNAADSLSSSSSSSSSSQQGEISTRSSINGEKQGESSTRSQSKPERSEGKEPREAVSTIALPFPFSSPISISFALDFTLAFPLPFSAASPSRFVAKPPQSST